MYYMAVVRPSHTVENSVSHVVQSVVLASRTNCTLADAAGNNSTQDAVRPMPRGLLEAHRVLELHEVLPLGA